jgi:hypothetical protein
MFQEVIRMKFNQFAALPYRMRDDDIEILLITTRKKRRWLYQRVGRLSPAHLNKLWL